MPFLEFHIPDIHNWFGPSVVLNLYILGNMIFLNALYVLGAAFIFLYLKRFYGERPIPQEWKIFWGGFIFYCLHELIETIGGWQLMVGQVYVVLLSLAEISAAILLAVGSYLLVKKYVLER